MTATTVSDGRIPHPMLNLRAVLFTFGLGLRGALGLAVERFGFLLVAFGPVVAAPHVGQCENAMIGAYWKAVHPEAEKAMRMVLRETIEKCYIFRTVPYHEEGDLEIWSYNIPKDFQIIAFARPPSGDRQRRWITALPFLFQGTTISVEIGETVPCEPALLGLMIAGAGEGKLISLWNPLSVFDDRRYVLWDTYEFTVAALGTSIRRAQPGEKPGWYPERFHLGKSIIRGTVLERTECKLDVFWFDRLECKCR